MTIALALLAYELAGEEGGAVLGTALAIMMIAYVSIAPLAAGLLAGLPRRAVLASLDLVRGGIALCLPFVDEVWQVYVLIFVLQSASAAFTPAFQTTIPDILGDEAQYTRALSLSWLAYDLANLASPMLAAALLLLGLGQGPTFAILAGLAVAAALLPPHLWPARDPEVVLHEHRNLPPEDTHLQGAPSTESGWQHAHAYVIDDRHPSWPAGEPAAVTRRR